MDVGPILRSLPVGCSGQRSFRFQRFRSLRREVGHQRGARAWIRASVLGAAPKIGAGLQVPASPSPAAAPPGIGNPTGAGPSSLVGPPVLPGAAPQLGPGPAVVPAAFAAGPVGPPPGPPAFAAGPSSMPPATPAGAAAPALSARITPSPGAEHSRSSAGIAPPGLGLSQAGGTARPPGAAHSRASAELAPPGHGSLPTGRGEGDGRGGLALGQDSAKGPPAIPPGQARRTGLGEATAIAEPSASSWLAGVEEGPSVNPPDSRAPSSGEAASQVASAAPALANQRRTPLERLPVCR